MFEMFANFANSFQCLHNLILYWMGRTQNSELRTQNSEIVYLTLNSQIHAIHKLNN